jgi:hypothetical protein
MAATAATYKSDIVIDPDCFETMPKRAFTTIRLYCSVVQSDDPDWKVDLAVEAVEATGICSEFVAQCFLLHDQTDLLFKPPSEPTWRLVKLGILSTITIKAVSSIGATSHGSSANAKVASFGPSDDSSLFMVLEKAEMEWDETTHDKENITTFPPIRQILVPIYDGGRSSWCSNNNSNNSNNNNNDDSTFVVMVRPKPRYSVNSEITTGPLSQGKSHDMYCRHWADFLSQPGDSAFCTVH